MTGDNWKFDFFELKENVFIGDANIELDDSFPKQTSLFSGGLDSLIGVINWLEENQGKDITLVGHYDRHITHPKTDQDLLFDLLRSEYEGRIELVQVRVSVNSNTSIPLNEFMFNRCTASSKPYCFTSNRNLDNLLAVL